MRFVVLVAVGLFGFGRLVTAGGAIEEQPKKKTCTHAAKERMGHKNGLKDAMACCAFCKETRGCKAWTFWETTSVLFTPASSNASQPEEQNKEQAKEGEETYCNLFDRRVTGKSGDCTSGGTHPGSPWVPPPPHGPVCKDCPNIIFSLTDDQDYLLGGWDDVAMRHTKRLLQETGAFLSQWRIHTAICSPSRSETISGRYFHNIKSKAAVPPPKVMPAASGHVNGSTYTNQTFGTYLRMLRGYQTALFGKGNFNTMEGFDRWFQGSHLGYGGTWQDNESPIFKYHANDSEYATDLLLAKATEWLRRSNVTGKASDGRPFFLYLAPHCPHIPATPADKYADACPHVTAPRPPDFNFSSPLLHELISKQPPFREEEAAAIDALARLRCQCLLSVDDAHKQLLETLQELGVASNTYWFVTSDHGYNLGNHRLPSNKFLLYEHSLRIPLVVNGPGVRKGARVPVLGTNVDYAPTWLGLADIDTPSVMDGRSLVPVLVYNTTGVPASTRRHLEKQGGHVDDPSTFRKEQFTQYYNQGPWQPDDPKDGFNRTLDDYSNTYIGITVLDSSLAPYSQCHSPKATTATATSSSSSSSSNNNNNSNGCRDRTGCYDDDDGGGGGQFKYGEYQYVCNSTQMLTRTCFNSPDWYELFDLEADPYELNNLYYHANTSEAPKREMHQRLRHYYPCKGTACP